MIEMQVDIKALKRSDSLKMLNEIMLSGLI